MLMKCVMSIVSRFPTVSEPRSSAFKAPRGEAAFLAAYDAAMKLWPVPYEEIDLQSRFGTTHVVVTGPKTAPPVVLLHGYMATLTMWAPNIAAFSKHHRVYAVDVMGQPSKSVPTEPIRSTEDFVAWLTATLDQLHLERVDLVGMSFGGWLALNYAVAEPRRVQKLVLLSPGGLLPMVKQFSMRGMLMVALPTRLTVNSFFRWLGFTDRAYASMLDLMYLGLAHFRMPTETARVMPAVVSDDALRRLEVPTLLLIGDREVISNPARALERARQLIPDFEGELVPGCRHDMCSTRHDIVDARVLAFLANKDIEQRLRKPTPVTLLGVLAAAAGLYWLPFRRWMSRWGTTQSDLTRVMPGDGLLPNSTYSGTMAVVVNARPEQIWPWLVQLGYQRGGLYSYDWLDRLFGYLDRPSATSVLPAFQHLAVGDEIPLGRGPGWPVAAVETNRALVLDMRNMPGIDWVWQFGLYPIDETRTQLVSRSRVRARTFWTRLVTYAIEPAGFLMTRRMLLGLKQRAEALRIAHGELGRTQKAA